MGFSLPALAHVEIAMRDAMDIAVRRSEEARREGVLVSFKDNDSPLTKTDVEIAALLRKRLLALTPAAGWLCEEDDVTPDVPPQIWVVDPLDGTKEFIRGLPEFSISIALLHNCQPVIGAVANPLTGEMGLWSIREGLVLKGFKEKSTAHNGGLKDAIANASRTEFEKGSLVAFVPYLKEIRPIGSVAYKLLRVAAGLEGLYFSVEPKSEWDLCGGVALVRAAKLEYRRFDQIAMEFTGTNTRINSGAIAGPADLLDEFRREMNTVIDKSQERIRLGIVK